MKAATTSQETGQARRALVLGAAIMLALATQACARVAPYERGTLARRDMQAGEHNALTSGEEHMQAYREGSVGGGTAKGGGCGCN